MANSPFVGKNTIFAIGNGESPGETFTAVAKVISIGEVSVSRDSVDVTTFDSADDYREFIPNPLKDAGEIQLELVWITDDVQHIALRNLIDATTTTNFKITWPDASGTSVTFAAFVTGFSVGTPIDDKATLSVTLKLSGKPIWA